MGGQLTGQLTPVGENDLHPLLHTLRDLNNMYDSGHGNNNNNANSGNGAIGATGLHTPD